jgi:curved DNA-binding protein CbpA
VQSYYDILGISKEAGDIEIKAAFRRLAKQYHPDKNPNGKEQFERILVAYEVLIDGASRSQYDLKLKYGNAQSYSGKKTQQKTQKEWNFTDEELKKRQYFQEHYKKEYERYSKSVHVPKKNYNEYKYILFAAPIAVGLFMFIVNGVERSGAKEQKKTHVAATSGKETKKDELKYTADPFTAYFGKEVIDLEANRSFQIKNLSAKDVVVALFDEKNKFIRSAVVKSGLAVTLEQLPASEMNIRFLSGNYWKIGKEHNDLEVIGGFTEKEKYGTLNTRETNGYSITLDDNTLDLLEEISEKEFFRKIN